MVSVNARSCAQAHNIIATLSITSWPQCNCYTSAIRHCVVLLFLSKDVFAELELTVVVKVHLESGIVVL